MLRVRAYDGKVIEVEFTTDERLNDLANRIGRDLLHYHGNFALKMGDRVFNEAAMVTEVDDFLAAEDEASVSGDIFDLVNVSA